MSGVLVIAPVTAVGLSLAVYALVAHLLRRRLPAARRIAAGFSAVILFPFFCALVWNAAFRLTASEGTGVTPDVASRAPGAIEIPAGASDVNYRSSIFEPVLFRADFAITESDFLEWARSHRWEITEFTPDDAPEYVDMPGLKTSLSIRQGYSCRIPGGAPEARTTIIFDAESSRAFVLRTGF